MPTNVSREWYFEAAHFLYGHEGKCSRLHGHTYKLRVEVRPNPNSKIPSRDFDDSGLIKSGSSKGMVIDFKDLDHIVKDIILDKWDHHFLASQDQHHLAEAVEMGILPPGSIIPLMIERTTAELLVLLLVQELSPAIQAAGLELRSATLWEGTANGSAATWEGWA